MASLGDELKRERELREISLREISQATKISMRILEAIEKNNYKVLPGGIFNRNFVRAYAEFIGLDPDVAVNKYYQQAAAMPDDSPLPQVRVAAPPESPGISKRQWVLIGSVIGLVILFAFLYGFFRKRRTVEEQGELLRPVPVTLQVKIG